MCNEGIPRLINNLPRHPRTFHLCSLTFIRLVWRNIVEWKFPSIDLKHFFVDFLFLTLQPGYNHHDIIDGQTSSERVLWSSSAHNSVTTETFPSILLSLLWRVLDALTNSRLRMYSRMHSCTQEFPLSYDAFTCPQVYRGLIELRIFLIGRHGMCV